MSAQSLRPLFSAFLLLSATMLRAEAPRLVNLSTRGQAGTANNVMIAGFVVGPGENKTVLLRAVGPGLATYISNSLANPALTLYSGTTSLATNDNWLATDAATMLNVGAFPLASLSLDAALVRALSPGVYTANVTGTTATSNLALVEVYEVSAGTSRLTNLSTRALVGTGDKVLIAGFVLGPGTGTRRLLLRGVGPGLASQIAGALADPSITVRNNSTSALVAANNDWGSAVEAAAIAAAFTQVGAFPLAAGSLDAALVVDLPPGNYSMVLAGAGTSTGIALAEVYDLTPNATATTVSVVASKAVADESGTNPGEFTLTRTGDLAQSLTVSYSLSGSANPGTDYTGPTGIATFVAGSATVTVPVLPLSDFLTEGTETVVLTIASGDPAYTPNYPAAATVSILDIPPKLYLAALRAPAAVANTTAYGNATLQLSQDQTTVQFSIAYANLSSPETAVYLRLGNPGEVGVDLVRLPNGQVSSFLWQIQASGALTVDNILQALKDGHIFLDIQTVDNPAGELHGTFIQSSGAFAFTVPAAPPMLADAALSPADTARFLTQATFGPTQSDIDALTGKHLADLSNWITAQIAVTPTLLLDATRADFIAYTASGDNPQFTYQNRQAAWWSNALNAPDQLRQRVAFALSEILVISDVNGTLYNNSQGMSNYYDLLVTGAFGNFRTLLENVTLSPIMGIYLSSLRNAKATFDANGAVLTSADENYAREVMQLFTIGLNQLQPDGTLKLDYSGLPIPTYTQQTITETAKIFTGWAFRSADATSASNFRGSAADYLHPMMLYTAFHDTGTKTIVGGVIVPANQDGTQDLKLALDTLFNHPNTGPFISRELIQRLVTSNPSPGYIYRVAQVFANNGSGVRGDLAAVVRAILTDYEARSSAAADDTSFGKLKEPLLRATALLRAFGGAANSGRYAIFNGQGSENPLGQTALHANTVFNFFEPNFVQPGTLAAAGLFAPEYQILTDTTAISAPNQLWNFIYANRSTTDPTQNTIGIQLTALLPLARTPQALINQTNVLLAGGSLTPATVTRLVTAITSLPNGTGATLNTTADIERVRSAIYLTLTSPQGAVQK